MNRLFVPLAQAYLNNAVDDVTDQPISHTDPEIVDPSVLDSLQEIFDRARGRWRRYEAQMAPVLPILAPFVAAFGYDP